MTKTAAPAQSLGRRHNILFVEDDRRLCSFLCRYFDSEGYGTEAVHDGEEMWRAIRRGARDLVVLDVGLPGPEDGYSLARALKAQANIGILFLSGRHEPVDRIVGLEVGADDYLCKPFEPRELLARVRAVLRRVGPAAAQPRAAASRCIRFDGWSLDLESHVLTDEKGRPQRLTSQEFNMLAVLAERPGRVLSRDQLLDLTANRHWSPLDRSIDVMIGKIRRKIGDTGPVHRRIRTMRGAGYMFIPPSS
ncbi:response regulator [Neotabrizicola sp. sgz301269]|uniref:response regulator n=1 Tax=Neotabrizicola sp. sgz301269 TaxID=3276282 RepID=UPI00376F9E4A